MSRFCGLCRVLKRVLRGAAICETCDAVDQARGPFSVLNFPRNQ